MSAPGAPTAPNPPTRAAPAGVWLAALALALSAATLMINLDRLWPALPHHAGQVYLNLQRLRAANGERPQVVGLGDSRLRFAVPHDAGFTAATATAAALPIDFVRITRNGARHVELAEALVQMCRTPPALLLLQADPMIWRRGRQTDEVFAPLQRWRDNTQNLRAYWSGPEAPLRAENLGGVADWRLNGRDLGKLSRAELRRRYADTILGWLPTSTDDLARWDADLSCLQSRGTEIIVLEMPRAPFAQAMLPAAMRAHEQARLAQLAARPGWQLWRAPPGFEDSDFFDAAHLDDDGQRRYSDWLREQLRGWLDRRQQAHAARPASGVSPP